MVRSQLNGRQRFSKIEDKVAQHEHEIWKQLLQRVNESQIQGITLDLFWYYYWNSKGDLPDIETGKNGDPIRQDKLRRSVQKYIEESENSADAVSTIFREVDRASKILICLSAALSSGGYTKRWEEEFPHKKGSDFTEINELLYGILVTESQQPLMLLISLLLTYLSDTSHSRRPVLSSRNLKKFLKQIANFQFRWAISQKGSSASQRKMYHNAAAGISRSKNGDDIHNALNSFIITVERLQPGDRDFKYGIRKLTYSND